MSKVITSPIKHFPGTVTMADPLTFPQAMAFEDAIAAIEPVRAAGMTKIRYALLPGVLACVEEWHLDGVSEHPALETFPATPKQSVAELFDWLVGEISALYRESENVPLA